MIVASDIQFLEPEGQTRRSSGDSSANNVRSMNEQKRGRPPSFEDAQAQHKRRPHIHSVAVVPVSIDHEPHGLPGHVKKREGQQVIAVPCPALRSWKMLDGIKSQTAAGGRESSLHENIYMP